MIDTSGRPENPRQYVNWFYQQDPPPYGLPVEPDSPEYGTTTHIKDHISLVEIVKDNRIKTILEIGTSRGYTAYLLSCYIGVDFVASIDTWKDDRCGDYLRKNPANVAIRASSLAYDFFGNHPDMVFIDGRHDLISVAMDTRMAFAMNPKVIVWHDYGKDDSGNECWPGVKQVADFYCGEHGFSLKTAPTIIAYTVLR